MKKLMILILLVGAVGLAACDTQADVASGNLSKAAEEFEIDRRITFINGITDEYLLIIEGKCSIEAGSSTGVAAALEVVCKDPDGVDGFVKHFLGLSDNVTYVVQQLNPAEVSTTRHRVIFRPVQAVPDIDISTSEG